MTGTFDGATVLVTGAGSGMGEATAVLLAERGANVALVGRREDRIRAVADKITAVGGRAIAIRGDVSRPDEIEHAVEVTVAEFGALTHAVNNAGITGVFEPAADLSVDDWNRVIGVNLSGAFYGLKFEIPPIIEAGGGAIVIVSSVFADRGGPSMDYSASKHALRGLTRSAAIDYGLHGVRINELQPGVIDTEMSRANPEGTKEVARAGIPLQRVGTAHEIATTVAFLLSDDASYITGAHIAVDGGFLA
jgi:NAD(P)-dependent dehydrogenase (short-subunit alcohol dehydrogenase family)